MAAKGGVGVSLDLDKIPARETGMNAYEYLLSESQERMLFVAHKGREAELIEIFERWGLHAVVAGEVLEEPIVRILWHGEIAAEIPATALADNTPIYHRQLADTPDYAKQAWAWDEQTAIASFPAITPNDALLQLLDTPAIASKAWVYRQYDHQVQNNTVIFPGGADAAVIRLRSQGFGVGELGTAESQIDSLVGVAATVDCNARYVYLDPYEGAKLAVAEAARNLSCVGSEPLSVTDNLNFGSPENAIGYWQLHEACRGIADACRELSTPVTGGNVSLYNETIDSEGNSQPIYPTPVIGMVGLVEDVTKVVGQGWQNVGDTIYLLGSDRASLAGSEYLASVIGEVTGRPQPVDFELERKVQLACRQGVAQGLIQSAHDCSEGGLAVAIAESCISGKLTAKIQLANSQDLHLTQLLFGEGASRIVVSVKESDRTAWEAYLNNQLGNAWQYIGTVSEAASDLEIVVNGEQAIALALAEITKNFNEAIPKRMGHIL
jgi:phosphoribosylformylglycinamidine synthase